MGKVYFLLGVHNHQPVGNFPYIFKEAYDKCYFPFLSVLKEFQKVKCSIHTSGPLYDWMGENGKEYIDILKQLVREKQVEVISGGYYEPILPLVSDEDKKGQIDLMNEFIEKQFKAVAGGLWLAERVWEPYLAKIINRCGLKYTFLDDTHFRHAGCHQEEFFGYYTTEDQALPISVFPISKTLRYKIPFSQAQEAVDLLNSFRKDGDVLVTLFDDGEKFGLWPHTFEWVYQKEWLKKFFSFLQEAPFIETILPAQAIEKFKSQGIVYLPTASYEEMGEWVLEPQSFFIYEELKNLLNGNNKFWKFKDFVRGGFFRNFYRKYSRLNYMHKRMLYLSKKVNACAKLKKDKQIFINIWKAQTNCGYWHGIFGGFYLGHIRASIYEKLITAENLFDKKFGSKDIVVETQDLDFDGIEESIVKNKEIICCFSPKGGSLLELSLRNPAFNLLSTITRREESYHRKIKEKVSRKGHNISTIHDLVTQKEDNLDKFLKYDKYERLCLVDHLLDKNLSIDDFDAQEKMVTLGNQLYGLAIKKDKKEVNLNYLYKDSALDFSKNIKCPLSCGFEVEYKFSSSGKKEIFNKYNFGIEFNLAPPSLKDIFKKERKRRVPLDEPCVWGNSNSLVIIDSHKNISLEFKFDNAEAYTLPIYSVSSSESGFEKVFQQISVLFIVKGQRDNFRLSFSAGKIN